MNTRNTVLLILGMLMASCSANKFLPRGERYFEGHNARYLGSHNVPKEIQYDLLSDLKPEATRRYFRSRPGTWLYQVMGTVDKDKGLKHFIKYKLGTKPTYLSALDLQKNADYVASKLRAAGYFRAEVEGRLDSSKHRADAVYLITPNAPYYFDSLFVCKNPESLCDTILAAHRAEPAIKSGELFQRNALKEARHRVAKYFNDRGYYYFQPEYTYFQADSNDRSHNVDLRWKMRENLPSTATDQYTLSDVTVNLAVGSPHPETIGDSLKVVIDRDKLFLKPRKLLPFLAYQPGLPYNRNDEEVTLKQLNRLEVFEFVNIQYDPDTSGGRRLLHAKLLARPRKKQSLSAEANISTTSTNYTGPGLQLEYYNRNLFRGAEKFRFTATGRYETQLSGERKGQSSYELDLLSTLLIPRVGLPFVGKSEGGNVPGTKYSLRYMLYNQPQYYAQRNIGASYGYEWLTGDALHNDLTLIGLDYLKLLRTSPSLEALFDEGILFRESFDDQLIFGPSYNLTYAPPPVPGKFLRFYASGNLGFSGNILYGAYKLTGQEEKSDGRYKITGIPFAQYTRLETDLRAYVNIGKYSQVVVRQNIGIGMPYLNSSALPFSKQFFVGGASSLRGFAPRSVGPGTYKNTDPDFSGFFDQSGDILIEYNAEHRFDLGKYFKGALFVDAGNVWLQNQNANRPGGVFRWKDFIDEFAVATGVGLRIDAQFVILRFDFGIPLRKPYLPDGNRWVFDEMSNNDQWVAENLVLNIAIGYPF